MSRLGLRRRAGIHPSESFDAWINAVHWRRGPGPAAPRLSPPGKATVQLNDEWTAERFFRGMLLPYGAAGRGVDELQTCAHCRRTYYRSNGGACPRCGGSVPLEPPRTLILPHTIS